MFIDLSRMKGNWNELMKIGIFNRKNRNHRKITDGSHIDHTGSHMDHIWITLNYLTKFKPLKWK